MQKNCKKEELEYSSKNSITTNTRSLNTIQYNTKQNYNSIKKILLMLIIITTFCFYGCESDKIHDPNVYSNYITIDNLYNDIKDGDIKRINYTEADNDKCLWLRNDDTLTGSDTSIVIIEYYYFNTECWGCNEKSYFIKYDKSMDVLSIDTTDNIEKYEIINTSNDLLKYLNDKDLFVLYMSIGK